VLQKFNKGEIETLKQLFPLLAESAKEWIKGKEFTGIMNKYN
jgi:hypothetical protein